MRLRCQKRAAVGHVPLPRKEALESLACLGPKSDGAASHRCFMSRAKSNLLQTAVGASPLLERRSWRKTW